MAKRYRFAFKRLDVYQAAVEHFEWASDVVQRMPRGPFKVVDQAVGASLSVMGNIGEAHGRDTKPGEIEQHYRYAQGSTFESATHLDAFSALGVISDEEYNAEESRLARIAMMLTRLIQKQRKRRREVRRLTRGAPARVAARGAVGDAEKADEAGKVGKVSDGENAREAGEGAQPGAPEGRGEVSNPREARPRARSASRFESRQGARGRAAPDGHRIPAQRGRRGGEAAEGDRISQSDGTEA